MPATSFSTSRASVLAALLASLSLAQGASAQTENAAGQAVQAAPAAPAASRPATKAESSVNNSSLDAPLFYQLLIGEIELREGDAGTAYQVMLDAARRSKDEQLFRRATEIALQARAGDQALDAAKAWRQTLPDSLDAHRYQIQLLIAMNRPADTLEPLRSLLKLAPASERSNLIATMPQFFARSTDRANAAAVLEQAVQPYLDSPDTRTAARVVVGQSLVATQRLDEALAMAYRAHKDDPTAEGPAGLALDMLPGVAQAEAIVLSHLQAKPDSNTVRLLYVRSLTGSQRFADAIAQLDIFTTREPNVAPPWLTLAALHLEMRHPAEAIGAAKKYVALIEAGGSATVATNAGAAGDEEPPATPAQALTQAWLLLAQASEQQGDIKGAEAWLAKIDSPQAALDVQTRRASLLVRQGKLAEARELIRKVPEKTPADGRAKLLAEAQLLRDAKRWADAYAVLGQANEAFPNDVDMLYEQSMMAEKLNQLDDMERLLRRVIELKPDHQHAYNALGYSLAERNMRLPEARSLIKKALDLSPGEPFITDSLGWVEYRLGNNDEALRLLRGAYQSRPDPEIAAHLGEVLWVSGRSDEARRVLREARSRDAANDVLRETLARLRVDL